MFFLIYWDGMDKVPKRKFPKMFRVWITKHVSGYCGVNSHLSHFDKSVKKCLPTGIVRVNERDGTWHQSLPTSRSRYPLPDICLKACLRYISDPGYFDLTKYKLLEWVYRFLGSVYWPGELASGSRVYVQILPRPKTKYTDCSEYIVQPVCIFSRHTWST